MRGEKITSQLEGYLGEKGNGAAVPCSAWLGRAWRVGQGLAQHLPCAFLQLRVLRQCQGPAARGPQPSFPKDGLSCLEAVHCWCSLPCPGASRWVSRLESAPGRQGVAGAVLVGCMAVPSPCGAGGTNRQLSVGWVCWGTACLLSSVPGSSASCSPGCGCFWAAACPAHRQGCFRGLAQPRQP